MRRGILQRYGDITVKLKPGAQAIFRRPIGHRAVYVARSVLPVQSSACAVASMTTRSRPEVAPAKR
ncbi:hypothetical protein MPC1_1640007 [Methylocella tundrae]|nr:hypothetical protein MPC1_1640007 [Methylocella tundrae]